MKKGKDVNMRHLLTYGSRYTIEGTIVLYFLKVMEKNIKMKSTMIMIIIMNHQ